MFLVEVFTVDYVIEKLKKGKYRSRDEILATSKYTWFAVIALVDSESATNDGHGR